MRDWTTEMLKEENIKAIIYLLTNTINGKQYVGFTSQKMNRRMSDHKKSAKAGIKTHLYNSIRKHGWDKFKSKILYMSTDKDECLKVAEVDLIAEYNTYENGYNGTLGGEGLLGYRLSETHKKALIESNKGVPKSAGHKKALSDSLKGRKHSEETRSRMSDSQKLSWANKRNTASKTHVTLKV